MPDSPPQLPLVHLSSLWFQVTGLLCNLECTHCLVDSSPQNRSMPFLDRETIRTYLREADALGVKEIYFTGGEPFLHREMTGILEDALAAFPTTVLTNGTLITERTAEALGALQARSRYSLEVRVSIDHPDPERNDAVRGAGAHEKAIRAVLRLERAGLLPIVTATEMLQGSEGSAYERFLSALSEAGVRRPRVKILPVFRTGKIEETGPLLTPPMLEGVDPLLLQCASARAVTALGIYACPILVGKGAALLGAGSLANGLGDVPLFHPACTTCYETGMTCANA